MNNTTTGALPKVSFKIWLETKDMLVAKHVNEINKPFFDSIPKTAWREDFNEGFSPIESIMAYFEDNGFEAVKE